MTTTPPELLDLLDRYPHSPLRLVESCAEVSTIAEAEQRLRQFHEHARLHPHARNLDEDDATVWAELSERQRSSTTLAEYVGARHELRGEIGRGEW